MSYVAPDRSRSQWSRRNRTFGACLLGALGAVSLAGASVARAEESVDLSQPLSLATVLRLAEERNLGYQQSLLTIDSAEGSLVSSRSQLLPSLRGSLGYGRSVANYSTVRIDPESGLPLPADVTNVTVESSLRLSGGVSIVDPGSWQSVRASSKNLESTKVSVEGSRQDLAWAMTQQYFALVRAKELTQVNAEAFQLSQEQLNRAQALYELGSVARSDVLQAQVNLASADRDRISGLNQVEQEKARLAVAIGVSVDAPVDVEDPGPLATPPPIQDEGALVLEAQRNRPDLQAASLGLQAASHGLSAAKWSRWPTLNASYNWSKRGGGPDDVLKKFDRDISYGGSLSLDWNLFDGFNTKGSIQRSEVDVATRRRALEEAELQAALEVREASLGIKNATESIRSTEEGVRLAEESAKLQQALYESGGGTLLEWNNSQVELTRARVSLVEAQVDLRLARAQLDLALGRLAAR